MPDTPNHALANLLAAVEPAAAESLPNPTAQNTAGRVLASGVSLTRDSPACDVSAMDGFAVRLGELNQAGLPIVGECPIGRPPEELAPGTARRIYTGAPLPQGADTVVRLERADDTDQVLKPLPDAVLDQGADIRRQAENANAGDLILADGDPLGAAAAGALASVGFGKIPLRRAIRIAVITTGSELDTGPEAPPPWRLRDSNGPALISMLSPAPWVAEVAWSHAGDELASLTRAVESAIDDFDAVILTGGVSKGAYDYVPEAVEQAGGQRVFHRIAARPGQPTLGAVCEGKPILGLPGNPLSVLCAGRRMLVPALQKRAGYSNPDPPVPTVLLDRPPTKTLPITWWRPVKLVENGLAEVTPIKGSGDLIGPAGSDGFVECPPESAGVGPYPFYSWHV